MDRVVIISLILVGGCTLTHGPTGDELDGAVPEPPPFVAPEICELAVPCNRTITIRTESDLEELRLCESVGGNLQYYGVARLTQIWLPCLTSISGDLSVYDEHHALTRLDMPQLTSVGGLGISGVSFASLDGLGNLRNVEEGVAIRRTLELNSLRALSNLRTVGGGLHLSENEALTSLDGLSNITTLGDSLNVSSNPRLVNLDGLGNLISVDGDLRVRSNSLLCQEEVDSFAAGVRTGGEEDLGNLDFGGPSNGWDGDC